MNILLLTGEYRPLQGGVGDYTHELGQALIELGAQVQVMTGQAPDALRPAHPPEPAPESPLELPVIRPVARWDWAALPAVLDQVGRIRPDILHIQYQTAAYAMHPAINFLPWWTRLRLGRAAPRLVVTYHDVKIPYLFPKAGPLRQWVTLFVARSSDAVFVTNEEDRQALASYRWRRPPDLIPIGSNIHPTLPEGYDRDQQRARWGFGPQDIVLCYFGFLNESKGGEDLIRVLGGLVKRGYNGRLVMVGGKVGASDPTNVAYARHIEELIDSLGLTDRVKWTGFSEGPEVSASLMAADICVLPYRDGVSFRRGSFMAALAHGRPIVSTYPRVPIPELVDGGNIALAAAGDVPALAARVEELAADRRRREALGHRAQELSRLFGWDRIARQHLEIYRDLT